jgi:hypothetical protein
MNNVEEAMIRIAITLAAAVMLLSTVAAAQDSTFHDAAGRVVGKERTDTNGVTTFSDAVGRTTGRARPS